MAEDAAPKSDPLIGQVIGGRYTVEKQIGEGGMGIIYAGQHNELGKRVAIKILRSDFQRHAEAIGRFRREAALLAGLGHPHIVSAFDFGQLEDGSTYYVMDLLTGQSLAALVATGAPLSIEQICHIAIQIADGLAEAHKRGIVHRDLKPDNIFLVQVGDDPYFVKILDFGIARNSSTKSNYTREGVPFGTPEYMSPEQADGKSDIDSRTDIYSLGIMLYQLVAGRLPFTSMHDAITLASHMTRPPPPIGISERCPPGFEELIMKCLAKARDERYQTMGELIQELRKFLGIAPPPGRVSPWSDTVPAQSSAHPASPTMLGGTASPVVSGTDRRRRWAVPAAAATLVVLVVAAFLLRPWSSTPLTISTSSPSASVAPTPAPTTVPQPTAEPSSAPLPSNLPSANPSVVVTPSKAKKQVELRLSPPTALAYREGKPLDRTQPVEVEEGERVTLTIQAPGFQSVMVTLDGNEGTKSVTLTPQPSIKIAPPPSAQSSQPKKPGDFSTFGND